MQPLSLICGWRGCYCSHSIFRRHWHTAIEPNQHNLSALSGALSGARGDRPHFLRTGQSFREPKRPLPTPSLLLSSRIFGSCCRRALLQLALKQLDLSAASCGYWCLLLQHECFSPISLVPSSRAAENIDYYCTYPDLPC